MAVEAIILQSTFSTIAFLEGCLLFTLNSMNLGLGSMLLKSKMKENIYTLSHFDVMRHT